MRDLKLNADHDLIILNGDLVLVEGPDQTAQHIKQRLLSISREWFLDLSLGLPWFDTILGKHRSLNLVEALIRGQIEATPNVVRLAAFNLEAVENVERTVRVTFHAVLEDGSDLSSEIII